MGLFDKLKRKEKQIVSKDSLDIQTDTKRDLQINTTGGFQIEFQDSQSNFKQTYDTTKLIVKKDPLIIDNQEVYKCAVSWYNSKHTGLFNEQNELIIQDSVNYKEVLAQIDLNLLQTDYEYYHIVMQDLLSKSRVEKYLAAGLDEHPNHPCGQYIGGVKKDNENYIKFFSAVIGKASHYSPLMQNRREENKKNIEIKKQNAIVQKNNQIKNLQQEIDDMSR